MNEPGQVKTIFSATLCTLRVLVPVAYISATASITAFMTCSASLRIRS